MERLSGHGGSATATGPVFAGARIARAGARLVGLTALALAGQASGRTSAVEARYSAAYRTCLATGDAAKGVTSGLLDCNGAEIDRQDARLNRTYRSLK